MNRQSFHTKSHFVLALLVAFTLSFGRFAPTPLFIALMLVNWLIEGDLKNKFSSIFNNKIALVFISFFALHVIGLIYTQNIDSGLFDLQVKFSLLLFPILLCSRPFDTEKTKNIFFALIAGAITASVILLAKATYTYFTLNLNRFFYQEFCFLIHPSYISLYIDLGIVWMLLQIFNKAFSRSLTIIAILVITFFSFIIILLASKMGLLTTVFIYVGFLIFYIVKKRKYLPGFIGLVVLSGIIFSSAQLFPEMTRRVERSIDAMSNPKPNMSDTESTTVRLLIWSAANEVISENFILGTGTGDSKDSLLKEYKKQGMTGAFDSKLNAHNEFYQVFISLGLIGFIIFLTTLLLPLGYAFKTSNGIYLVFLLIMIFNFLPESMLETQAGVIFYAFFNSLLCFKDSTLVNQHS